MKINIWYNRWMKRFLDGPEWFQIVNQERRNGAYRMPTLAFFVWILAWLWRIFTIPALLALIPAGLLVLYSTISLESPVRIAAMALFLIITIDFLVGWVFRPKLRIKRLVPDRVRAGSKFHITYQVTNLRNFPAWDLEFDRYIIKKGLEITNAASVEAIKAKETVTLSALGLTERRGVYRLFSPIADSLFPLSLTKWSYRNKGNSTLIKVYPAFAELHNLTLPSGSRFQREGASRVSKIGESMDFYGCRDYRDGDDPRHIYWTGSARRGELVVKEFRTEYLSRVALIVDIHVPRRRWQWLKQRLDRRSYAKNFEAALSLTSAIADFLTRSEYVVDIFATGSQVYHFQTGRHLACFDSILDILAELDANPKPQLNDLPDQVLEEIAGIGSVLLIFLSWDDERAQLVTRLREAGAELKIILIDATGEIPDFVQLINSNEINSGRVRDL